MYFENTYITLIDFFLLKNDQWKQASKITQNYIIVIPLWSNVTEHSGA